MKKYLIIAIAVCLLASCSSTGWVTKPYSAFSEKDYVCAVGYGKTQEEADLNAKVELASLFGMAVDSTVSRTVMESSVTDGTSRKEAYGEFFTMDAKTSVKVENLYGVSIEKREGKDGSYHALAVMRKDVTLDYYLSHRDSTKETITNLENDYKKHYGTLSAVTDAVKLIELASSFNTETAMCNYLSDGDAEYMMLSVYKKNYVQAMEEIVLEVNVEGDESGVVKSSISKILTDNGFKVNKGGQTPNAAVNVSIVWMETQGTGVAASFVFAEHNTDVSFVDLAGNRTLFVYYSKGKEGHQNIDSAKTRCLKKLVDELEEEFRKAVEAEFSYGGTEA